MSARRALGARRLVALVSAASALAACNAGGVVVIGRDEQSTGTACAPACASSASGCAVDYCASLPPLAAPPTIDGVLDCGLSLAVMDAAGFSGNEAKPPELAVAYAVAWRSDGIYLFADVREAQRLPAPATASVYCGDAAHVFVDDDGAYQATPAYDAPGTRQLVAAAPADATTASAGARGERYAPGQPVAVWAPSHFSTFPTETGYVLEAFVAAGELDLPSWTLVEGAHVGFDLSVSVGGIPSLYNDPACPKRGDFILRKSAPTASTAGFPHDDTRAFCNPVLAASR